MKYKIKIVSLVLLMGWSISAYAEKVTNAIAIKLQMNNANFTGTPYNLTKPLCVSTDSHQSIPISSYMRSTGEANPSPLPGVKYETCAAGRTQQTFDYVNEQIISSAGSCLTRVADPVYVLNNIRESEACTSGSFTMANSWDVGLNTSIEFQVCDESNLNQKWGLSLVNNTYQISAGNNTCLSLSGRSTRGSTFYNLGTGVNNFWRC